jgi:UDP-glucose 4-epimerase
VMDTGRARRILGWEAKTSSVEAVLDVLDGIGKGEGITPSPLLKPRHGTASRS